MGVNGIFYKTQVSYFHIFHEYILCNSANKAKTLLAELNI